MSLWGSGAPGRRARLERARDVVLAVQRPRIAAARSRRQGISRCAPPGRSGPAAEGRLWIVLVGAAVVLAVATLRLARRDPPASA